MRAIRPAHTAAAWATAVGLVVLLVPACDPLPRDAFITSRSADVPVITIGLHAAGGDAIDIYLPDRPSARFKIAEAVATWLGRTEIPQDDDFDPDVATIQTHGRLVTRTRSGSWELRIDTSGLQTALSAASVPKFDLEICTPPLETALNATPEPDDSAGSAECYWDGWSWNLSSEGRRLEALVTLVPHARIYVLFAIITVVLIALFTFLAVALGRKLRSTTFRTRNAAAVAIGLIGGAGASFGLSVGTGFFAGVIGPADNLALAQDLGPNLYTLSIAVPALAAALPGLLFMALLVRRRPWSDEPPKAGAWPPPAPGPWGRPPPPPLPWER